ncbi:hypothetical protein Tco_0354964 [Tanacetum coccineum]
MHASYALDINLDIAEEVLLHQKLLALAKDPENRPVFHVCLLESRDLKIFWARADADEDQQELTVGPAVSDSSDKNREMGFEPCSKLKDLNLEVKRNFLDKDKEDLDGDSYTRSSVADTPSDLLFRRSLEVVQTSLSAPSLNLLVIIPTNSDLIKMLVVMPVDYFKLCDNNDSAFRVDI